MNQQAKKESVKISRAGVYLKPCLVEVAHCAVKDKIKYTKNNFCGSLKQLLSLGLTSDELINLVNQNVLIE